MSNPPDRPLDGVQDIYGDDDVDGQSRLMYHSPEEEIAMAPACWLWDYLRYKSIILLYNYENNTNNIFTFQTFVSRWIFFTAERRRRFVVFGMRSILHVRTDRRGDR